jgi:putative transposase
MVHEQRTFAERKATFRNASAVPPHGTPHQVLTMLGECFDPRSEFLISEHFRPHWAQAGAVVFITFRTNDSIPRAVLERWDREKREWLKSRLHDADGRTHWSVMVQALGEKDRTEFHKKFNRCRETYLDTCHGRCLLKRPELAEIVGESLLSFDGERYRMGDFVVMPNHVHLLAVFPTADAMHDQCDSWLHYTAFRINQTIGEKGKFWQQEVFDHLVRNPEQYEYLRQYIADNPKKARLGPKEYYHRRFDG